VGVGTELAVPVAVEVMVAVKVPWAVVTAGEPLLVASSVDKTLPLSTGVVLGMEVDTPLGAEYAEDPGGRVT